MDLIYYDDPDYYDTYVIVANNTDQMIEKTVLIVSRILAGIAGHQKSTQKSRFREKLKESPPCLPRSLMKNVSIVG